MSMMTAEDQHIKRIVQRETKPLKEEIARLRLTVEGLKNAVSSLSRGYEPLA